MFVCGSDLNLCKSILFFWSSPTLLEIFFNLRKDHGLWLVRVMLQNIFIFVFILPILRLLRMATMYNQLGQSCNLRGSPKRFYQKTETAEEGEGEFVATGTPFIINCSWHFLSLFLWSTQQECTHCSQVTGHNTDNTWYHGKFYIYIYLNISYC